MRVVQINSFGNLSTGSVMRRCHKHYLEEGYESWMIWARGPKASNAHEWVMNSKAGICIDGLFTRLDGRAGFHSKEATKRLLLKLDKIKPDVVHLHNIHGYYINIEMLFDWLAKHDCQVKWTLHDCWAFTGHCGHFTYVKCMQWKTHCGYNSSCPQLHLYPKTISKRSYKRNFTDKKRIFTSVPTERMMLITPSRWLEGLVKQSFLKDYSVEVRHNQIDRTVFKPTLNDFKERYGVGDRFMILGVASTWSKRKGLDDFIRLSSVLDASYSIVLVGLNKKQLKLLPDNILGLQRTDSIEDLAKIYSAADVFFNPTKEDNYPTVNLEAEACGTPVVCYDTGGCKETLEREDSKIVSGYRDAVGYIEQLRGL